MVNGKYSNWDIIEYGVPQGSTLGLLLFIMYTNDLIDFIRNSDVLLHADDTVIYRSDVSYVQNYRNIQGDLNRLLQWYNKNTLTINGRKTRIVNCGQTKKLRTVQPLHINKEDLSVEKLYKYLGIILDSSPL